MSTFQERVIEEKKQLDEKLDKLSEFLDGKVYKNKFLKF